MSGIATGTALMIGGGLAAAGGIGSAIIGSKASGKAVDAQVAANERAAELQKQAADQSLAFQKQVYGNQQRLVAPYAGIGTSANVNLARLLGVLPSDKNYNAYKQNIGVPSLTGDVSSGSVNGPIISTGLNSNGLKVQYGPDGNIINTPLVDESPSRFGAASADQQDIDPITGFPVGVATDQTTAGSQPSDFNLSSLVNPDLGAEGSLLQGYSGKFEAPTDVTEKNDPGYQFRLKQGQQALERSAAARGGLLSGGTGKALTQYGQDYASNEYGNVYNRALTNYTTAYNAFNNDQANKYNRLAALAGTGQVAAGQLGQSGTNAATGTTNILLNSANQQGQYAQNIGNATASGYINNANAINQGIGSLGGGIQNYLMLRNLLGSGLANPTGAGQSANDFYYSQVAGI